MTFILLDFTFLKWNGMKRLLILCFCSHLMFCETMEIKFNCSVETSFVRSDPLTFVLPRWQVKSTSKNKWFVLEGKFPSFTVIVLNTFEPAPSLLPTWLNTGNHRWEVSLVLSSGFIYPASMWCEGIKLKLTYFPMFVFNLNAKTWLQPRGDNRFNNLITEMLSRSRNDRTNSTPLAIITRNADKRKRTLPACLLTL